MIISVTILSKRKNPLPSPLEILLKAAQPKKNATNAPIKVLVSGPQKPIHVRHRVKITLKESGSRST